MGTQLDLLFTMNSITSEILYQNEAEDITIIDLPTSIELAQTLPKQTRTTYALYSSEPLQEPHRSIEPKSVSAKANLLSRMGQDRNSEFELKSSLTLQKNLNEIRQSYQGDWYLPRQLSPSTVQKHSKKRKFDSVDVVVQQEPELLELQQWERFGRKFAPQNSAVLNLSAPSDRYVLSGYQALSHRVICNPQSKEILLVTPDPKAVYRIPPLAAFYLASIDSQTAKWFSQSVSRFYSTPSSSAGPGQFDFILLDPPWQNRSVTRSQKYKTTKGTDPLLAVQGILGKHIAPRGLVACWTTNNPNTRMVALRAFQDWDVHLIEEWTWLKITAKGEPVYDTEGLWRKPYETLLVGRKIDESIEEDKSGSNPPKFRFFAAVPDLHSRKPCLRSLIASMTPDAQNYRALEIFARNLTAGWWAWGDDVLKFNWQGHWKKVKDGEENTGAKLSTLEQPREGVIEAVIDGGTPKEDSIKGNSDGPDGPPRKMARLRK